MRVECWVSSTSRREGLRSVGDVDIEVVMRRCSDDVEGLVRVAAFRASDRRLVWSVEGAASELLGLAERLRAVAAGGVLDGARGDGGVSA